MEASITIGLLSVVIGALIALSFFANYFRNRKSQVQSIAPPEALQKPVSKPTSKKPHSKPHSHPADKAPSGTVRPAWARCWPAANNLPPPPQHLPASSMPSRRVEPATLALITIVRIKRLPSYQNPQIVEANKRHHPLDLNTLKGHGDSVTGLCFSSDGRSLATGTLPSKLWEVFAFCKSNNYHNEFTSALTQCISFAIDVVLGREVECKWKPPFKVIIYCSVSMSHEDLLPRVLACADGVVRVFKLDDASSKSFKFLRINLPVGCHPTAVAFCDDASSLVVTSQAFSGSSLYMYGEEKPQATGDSRQQTKLPLPEIKWEHHKAHDKRAILTLVGTMATYGSADGSTILASSSDGIDSVVLVKNEAIRDRWKSYFETLLVAQVEERYWCEQNKMSVAEMRMLRWICGKTRRDRIRNETVREMVGVAPIEEKLRENRLRWFGHVYRRPGDAVVKRADMIALGSNATGRGSPKLTLDAMVHKDMSIVGTDIKIWHGKTGKTLGNVDTNQLKNNMATISPNGRFVAAAAFTADVKVWEIIYSKDGAVKEVSKVMQLKGHKSAVTWLCFSPNSEQIITASKDGTIRIWNINVQQVTSETPILLATANVVHEPYALVAATLTTSPPQPVIHLLCLKQAWKQSPRILLGVLVPVLSKPQSNSYMNVPVSFEPRSSDVLGLLSRTSSRALFSYDLPLVSQMPLLLTSPFLEQGLGHPEMQDHFRYHQDEDPKTLKVFPIPLHDSNGTTMQYDRLSISPDGRILAVTNGSTLQWLSAETGQALDTADRAHDGDITDIAWAPRAISNEHVKVVAWSNDFPPSGYWRICKNSFLPCSVIPTYTVFHGYKLDTYVPRMFGGCLVVQVVKPVSGDKQALVLATASLDKKVKLWAAPPLHPS
ncbi:hypothetical protein RHGRI_001531 [Rhododendron griersonianum]|uniref:Transducin/WD40 repeat-like superfamily protein n=1 Tax=Rhododendron griersonianum TaxID=479676 RepID=A0AAV6LKG1_9ERIC|nr:hypothetical protein RHGRI_001531 [Rhododendron griersonianum]